MSPDTAYGGWAQCTTQCQAWGKHPSGCSSLFCCLSPMLRCQLPFDKCTKQLWVPAATTSPSPLDPPWQGELPGDSLAGWLLPLAAAKGDLTKSVPALPNQRDEHSTWPSPPTQDTHPIAHAMVPLVLPAGRLAHRAAGLQKEWVISCIKKKKMVLYADGMF